MVSEQILLMAQAKLDVCSNIVYSYYSIGISSVIIDI